MPAGAWQRPTKEAFLENPVPYLEELYDKLWSEIYEPVWRLQGSSAVPAASTDVAIALDIDREPFQVTAVPSWDTTVWVTGKSTTGFTLHFGTPPAGDETIDYIVIQSEAGVV